MPRSNVVGTRRWQRGMRSAQVRSGGWLASATYTQKWLVLGTLVGIIAGLGAVVFYEHCASRRTFSSRCLRATGSRCRERGRCSGVLALRATWAIPLIACVGALAGAVLVFTVAPEAEGHGTDAAIAAVHHTPVEFVCALSS